MGRSDSNQRRTGSICTDRDREYCRNQSVPDRKVFDKTGSETAAKNSPTGFHRNPSLVSPSPWIGGPEVCPVAPKKDLQPICLSLEEVKVLEGKTPQHILESGKTTERQNYLNIETKNLQKKSSAKNT